MTDNFFLRELDATASTTLAVKNAKHNNFLSAAKGI